MTEILILDFNRPKELYILLNSLKRNAIFNKKIVVLNNGGEKYADEALEQGFCDKVIHNQINVGCGLGTIQLFAQCESEFAFYIQVDHELQISITEDDIDFFKDRIILNHDFYIDLAGDQGHGQYSERAQFIKKSDYLSAPISAGGPGPLEDLKWSEESIQNYIKEKEKKYFSFYKSNCPPFRDCGWSSVRENPDGSSWYHQPDTKLLKCLKKPVEKFTFPPLTDGEWQEAIAGNWPEEGKIPESWREHSFEVWNKLK